MLLHSFPSYRLMQSYPGFIAGVKNNYILYKDGSKEIFDDKKQKSFNELLKNSDLEDTLKQEYPFGKNSFKQPDYMHDPGRFRNYELLRKMYGSTRGQVEKNLTYIKWMPKTINRTIMVTRINGVDKKLTAISNEFDDLPKEMKKYVAPLGGTFKWRYIKGTHRLSTHSFGIAIDINTQYSDYWRWNKNLKYKNRIPKKIVEIFEKHGFIWGGRWYHYDTMHFEYRPELLVKQRLDIHDLNLLESIIFIFSSWSLL